MVDLVVLRRVAGHRVGDIVSVSVDDERWANHVGAGNAKLLEDAPTESVDDDHGFVDDRELVSDPAVVYDFGDDEALD